MAPRERAVHSPALGAFGTNRSPRVSLAKNLVAGLPDACHLPMPRKAVGADRTLPHRFYACGIEKV